MRIQQLRATIFWVLAILFTASFVGRLHAQELPEIPQDVPLKALIRETMGAFSDAVNLKRFDKFRATDVCSDEFLNKTSAKQMGDEFKPFIDNHINLSALKDADVIIDGEPAMVEGTLRVAGHFETQPMRVLFDLAYLYQSGKWRLFGITVGLKKAPAGSDAVVVKTKDPGAEDPIPAAPKATGAKSSGGAPKTAVGAKAPKGPPAPSSQLLSIDNKMRSLITATMVDFNTALKRKDFTQFISKASPPMRQQTKPADLMDAYALFIKENVDMSDVAKTEPHFLGSPSVQNGSILNMKGYYQIAPMPVMFDAQYFNVSGEWKLLGLNVQTVSPSDLKDTINTGVAPAPDKPDGDEKPPVKKPTKTQSPADGDKSDGDMKKDDDVDMKKDPDMKKDGEMAKDPDMKKEEK